MDLGFPKGGSRRNNPHREIGSFPASSLLLPYQYGQTMPEEPPGTLSPKSTSPFLHAQRHVSSHSLPTLQPATAAFPFVWGQRKHQSEHMRTAPCPVPLGAGVGTGNLPAHPHCCCPCLQLSPVSVQPRWSRQEPLWCFLHPGTVVKITATRGGWECGWREERVEDGTCL